MSNSKSLYSLIPTQISAPAHFLGGALSLAALLLATSTGSVVGQAIYDVGVPDGGSASGAYGVSGNGLSVAVGADPLGEGHAYRWTLRKGSLDLGSLPGAFFTAVNGISRDGSALVGAAFFPDDSARAWLWTSEEGLRDLGLAPNGFATMANGVSRKGTVVVGDSFDMDFNRQGFRWTEETGLQTIGILPGGTYSGAQAVSADGSTLVGQADASGVDRAFRWTSKAGIQLLPLLSPQDPMANAFGVNHNGSLVAGFSGTHAVVWSKGGIRDLGTLPGDNNAVAYALNPDGTVVGGYSFARFQVRATLWTKAGGMVDLNAYLPTRGINLNGWKLQYTRGVSDDGRTIVGEGTYLGESRGWVVHLAGACDRDEDDDREEGKAQSEGRGTTRH